MRKIGKALTVLTTLVLMAFPFFVWWKAQALVDWWALRGYTPPAKIVELASATSMTEEARHIFYVNHPELVSDVNGFRKSCPQSEQTIVLGCYHSGQDGIDIYDVKDPRLAGVEEVTAAHEMLHAAYDRLDRSDKDKLAAELQDYYDNGLKDQRIIDNINAYQGLSRNDLVNEMHSIFGTEAANLPPTLEQHYKHYFNNRAEVVSLAENYEQEFISRKKAIEDYDKRLEVLKGQIDVQTQALEQQRQQIVAERNRLDSLRASGRVEEYNSGVAGFNAQVDSYNAAIARLRRDINTYNTLVAERNALAKELQSLDDAIDTRIVPEPVQ